MGWCHEFGPRIDPSCTHPMVASTRSCYCDVCGCACTGQFAGCESVWASGPRKIPAAEAATSTVGPRPGHDHGPDVTVQRLAAEVTSLKRELQEIRSELAVVRRLAEAHSPPKVNLIGETELESVAALRAAIKSRLRAATEVQLAASQPGDSESSNSDASLALGADLSLPTV